MMRRFFLLLQMLAALVLAIPATARTTSLTISYPCACPLPNGRYTFNMASDTCAVTMEPWSYYGTSNGIRCRLTAGNGRWWQVVLRAANGQPLAVGSYLSTVIADRAYYDRPQLGIYGSNGSNCYYIEGSFEVKEVTYNPDGSVASLWAIGGQDCAEPVPPLSFELKYNLDEPTPTLIRSWGALKAIYR